MTPGRRNALICLALAAGTAALYSPAAGFSFVNFDDQDYVIENYRINSGFSISGVYWCFQAGYAGNWHPLTWLSHMLDCQLYGLNPAGHHLTSVLLHVMNSMLVFLVLRRMTGAAWRSAMVAALFAWHPMHVESVAWIAERKDTLSAFFCLLTLWAYTRSAENLKSQSSMPGFFYALALFFYSFALMAKPMAVTLPCLMILLDWWPLRRFRDAPAQKHGPRKVIFQPGLRWLLFEKVPFLLMAALCCGLTLLAQGRAGAIASLHRVSLQSRLYTSVAAYCGYIGKLLVPLRLAAIYPILPGHRPLGLAVAGGLLLLSITAIVVAFRRTRPYWFVGWFWFLGTLIPVIGLIQVGAQSMADRYTYVPSVGIFIIVCWTASDFAKNWRNRTLVLAALAVVILGACAAVTTRQIQYWRNGGMLFAHAIAVTPNNYVAHCAYADYLIDDNKLDDARLECQKALLVWKDYPGPHLFLGAVLYRQRAYDDARKELKRALNEPWDAQRAEDYLGRIALIRHTPIEAELEFRKELQINPDIPSAHCGLAKALALQGRRESARNEFEEALNLCPDYPEARGELRRLNAIR